MGCRLLSIVIVIGFCSVCFSACGQRHGYANLNVLEEAPDGSRLLYGGVVLNSDYEAVTMWDIARKKALLRFPAPETVLCLLIASNSTEAFVGGEFPGVLRYDLANGNAEKFLVINEASVHALAESPDGRLFAAGGLSVSGGFINLYDKTDKSLLWKARLKESDHVVIDLIFDSNSAILYAMTAVEFTAWDVLKRKELFSYSQSRLLFRNLQYVKQKSQFVIGDLYGMLHIFDLNGKKVNEFQAHDGTVYDVEMIDRMNLLISTGKDSKIKKWRISDWGLLQEDDAPAGVPTQLEGSISSHHYWVGDTSGRVKKLSL